MQKLTKNLVLLAAFLLVAISSLFYGLYEREMAKAVNASVVFNLDSAKDVYRGIDTRLSYIKWIPFILDDEKNEMTVRRAEINYWQKDYSNFPTVDKDDTETKQLPHLLFIRANSEYRIIENETDKRLVVEGLERAINNYGQTIKDDSDHFDAAFNYEYLLKLRDDVAKGKRPLPLNKQNQKGQANGQKPDESGNQPDSGQGMHGKEGTRVKDSVETKIKVHVPLESDEAKEPGGKEAGKGDAQRKKG